MNTHGTKWWFANRPSKIGPQHNANSGIACDVYNLFHYAIAKFLAAHVHHPATSTQTPSKSTSYVTRSLSGNSDRRHEKSGIVVTPVQTRTDFYLKVDASIGGEYIVHMFVLETDTQGRAVLRKIRARNSNEMLLRKAAHVPLAPPFIPFARDPANWLEPGASLQQPILAATVWCLSDNTYMYIFQGKQQTAPQSPKADMPTTFHPNTMHGSPFAAYQPMKVDAEGRARRPLFRNVGGSRAASAKKQ